MPLGIIQLQIFKLQLNHSNFEARRSHLQSHLTTLLQLEMCHPLLNIHNYYNLQSPCEYICFPDYVWTLALEFAHTKVSHRSEFPLANKINVYKALIIMSCSPTDESLPFLLCPVIKFLLLCVTSHSDDV